MSLKLEDLSPYLDRESAVEWLRRDLGGGTAVSRKAMYHLNIINHFLQNDEKILKRLPSRYLGGLPEGGRRNVAASALLRAENAAGEGKSQDVLPSGYTREQQLVGTWAERDGCWSDYAESELNRKGYDLLSFGSEARVFTDNGNRVYKTVDLSHCLTLQKALDRISLHNIIFPETAMRVEGFGMRDNTEDLFGFVLIISQPFVAGKNIRGPESGPAIEEQLYDRTFELVRPAATKKERQEAADKGLPVPMFAQTTWCFTDKEQDVLLYDLHDENFVFSRSGYMLVFDCEIKLNDTERFGGPYAIPPVEFSESAVKKIGGLLEHIAPMQMDRLEFEMMYDSPKSKIHDQLRDRGRCEGLVDVSGTPCLVALDPADDENVLILPHDSAALMSRLLGDYDMSSSQRADVARGLTVRLDRRTTVAFDLDKGRPVKVTQRSKYQGTVESARQKESIPEPSTNTLKR